MLKLDVTHIADRLRKRLAELEAGAEVAAKDVRALLTPEQSAAMEATWAEQQAAELDSLHFFMACFSFELRAALSDKQKFVFWGNVATKW